MTDPKKKRKEDDEESEENLEDLIIEDEEMSDEEAEEFVKGIAQKLYVQERVIESQKKIIEKYQQQINKLSKPSSSLKIALSQEETSYADIGGLDSVLEKIKHFEYGIDCPYAYSSYGIDPPKGLLMYGPPGTGKTMIAKAMSNELGCWFLEIPLSLIISKYVGEAEQNLEAAIDSARKKYHQTERKVMLFVDEAEQMFRKKGSHNGHEVVDRCVNVWLRTMDGMGSNEGLIFVAATNYLEKIDDALLRAGRFDYIVEISKPNFAGVEDIFLKQMRMKEMKAKREIYQLTNLEGLSEMMYACRMTGADIANVLQQASFNQIQYFMQSAAVGKPMCKEELMIRDQDLIEVISLYDRVKEEKKFVGFNV
jgi:transitional endoplasmic reticulum ATPase